MCGAVKLQDQRPAAVDSTCACSHLDRCILTIDRRLAAIAAPLHLAWLAIVIAIHLDARAVPEKVLCLCAGSHLRAGRSTVAGERVLLRCWSRIVILAGVNERVGVNMFLGGSVRRLRRPLPLGVRLPRERSEHYAEKHFLQAGYRRSRGDPTPRSTAGCRRVEGHFIPPGPLHPDVRPHSRCARSLDSRSVGSNSRSERITKGMYTVSASWR